MSDTAVQGRPIDPSRPGGGRANCKLCKGGQFRRSNLRSRDYLMLALLRYPVRCMRCNQRTYLNVLSAASMPGPKTYQGRVDAGDASWEAWTNQQYAVTPTPDVPSTQRIATGPTGAARP